jgi:diguanylate cyclase (GGDEF)-like protein/PAS domain S-box-containing protein
MSFWRKKFIKLVVKTLLVIVGIVSLKVLEMVIFQRLLHGFYDFADLKVTEEFVDIIVLIMILAPYTLVVISQQRKAKGAEEKYRVLADNSLVGTYTLTNGKISYVNQQFLKMTGHTLDELIGTDILDLVHPEDKPIVAESINRRLSGEEETARFEVRFIKKDKGIIDIEILGTVINTDEGPQIIGSMLDITERKINEKLLQDLAYKDSLTGLPNRRFFEANFNNSKFDLSLNNLTAAVLFMDLDGFKAVNDSFGHDIGDLVIKETTNRLLSCIRQNDVVSRMGGDEFIAFLPNTHQNGATQVVERILREINEPFFINNQEIYVTTSIGIAFYPNEGNDFETLIRKADTAMYQAKMKGKNTYAIYSEKVSAVN